MTNREKFKEVFGKDIKWSEAIEPQMLALKSAQINGIDCMEEWLNAEYKAPTTKSDKPLIKCNICKYYTKMEGCLNDRCERFKDTTHPYCYCFWGKEKGADGNDD